MTIKEQARDRMAVFNGTGKKGQYFCGYGLYNTRFSHFEKTWKAADAWAAAENAKLAQELSV